MLAIFFDLKGAVFIMKKILSALIIVCLLLCSCSSSEESSGGNKQDIDNESVLSNYDNLEKLDSDYLFDNADDYKGKNVMSIATVGDISGNDVKLKTPNNMDSLVFSFDLNCNDEDVLDSLETEKEICFVGKVVEKNVLGGCVDISNAEIVASGSNVEKYRSDLKSNDKKTKKQKAKKKKNSKKSYMESCKTYSYNKIKRNPDKFKGKKTKLSGKVIQLDEGWFDSVTIRVEDSNGDDWYVSYSYSDGESKILENDKVTIYGECDGTEQYTTIAGNTRRVPAIDAKYVK